MLNLNIMVCCSCGLCCSKSFLCNSCEIATLKANGLSINLLPEITGLEYKSTNHSFDYEFTFSKMGKKINELIKATKPR